MFLSTPLPGSAMVDDEAAISLGPPCLLMGLKQMNHMKIKRKILSY